LAESTLSLGWADLKSRVGFFLGYGRTVASFTAVQEAEVEEFVQSGVRLVYYPTALSADATFAGYEWSWLRPTEVLDIYKPYAIGTVTIVAGVVTLADGTFPSWAADGELTIDGESYSVDTRDGDAQITLDNLTVTADAGSSYSLAQADYDLPDNFGRMIGRFNFPQDSNLSPVDVVSVGKLLSMRAGSLMSGSPSFVAIRYKSSTGATGQRQEALFYPDPDDDWTMLYEYEAYSGALSDALPYPLGGMQLAELYTESCLAVAEGRANDEPGVHSKLYESLLVDAIIRDRKRGAKNYGQMGHQDYQLEEGVFRRGYTGGTYPLTYRGELI